MIELNPSLLYPYTTLKSAYNLAMLLICTYCKYIDTKPQPDIMDLAGINMNLKVRTART